MIDKYLIDEKWKSALESEFKQSYFKELEKFLKVEYAQKNIFPVQKDIFNAFNKTPLDKVKVVIVGQDPYHGLGQAHGLCFSVLPPNKVPPSLRNIFKELNRDLSFQIPGEGNLEKWSTEGVLLLNSILTVEESKPMSHQKKGWEKFTEKTIEILNDKTSGLVFLAWGAPAISKVSKVDAKKHLVLTSVHPSPLSAHRGFIGCGHFSKCNEYLKANGKKEINWNLN